MKQIKDQNACIILDVIPLLRSNMRNLFFYDNDVKMNTYIQLDNKKVKKKIFLFHKTCIFIMCPWHHYLNRQLHENFRQYLMIV